MDTNTDSQSAKAPKIRSVAYPSVSIQAAIDLTKRINDEFTDLAFTPKDTISQNLNVSGGGLDRNLSSCVQYGLLELNKGSGYKPTPLFKKIKRPLPSENILDLHRECMGEPELYKKLLRDFNDKQLPTVSGLANILDRMYSVKGDAAERAARVFLNNLETLELIGSDNILKIEGGITPTEEVSSTPTGDSTSAPIHAPTVLMLDSPSPTNNHTKLIETVQMKEIPVLFKNGREAKIVLPIDFTDDEIKKIHKVIGAYLPD